MFHWKRRDGNISKLNLPQQSESLKMGDRIFTRFIFFAFALIALSCNKDDPEKFIDPRLVEYFDRFVDEASQRGIAISYEEPPVNGYIRLITSQDVIGQCAHQNDEPNTVIIDKIYFDQASDLEKEFVIFHELGHCVLNRDHIDVSNSEGHCISIMTSGTGQCFINYTSSSRQRLLDELFGQ